MPLRTGFVCDEGDQQAVYHRRHFWPHDLPLLRTAVVARHICFGIWVSVCVREIWWRSRKSASAGIPCSGPRGTFVGHYSGHKTAFMISWTTVTSSLCSTTHHCLILGEVSRFLQLCTGHLCCDASRQWHVFESVLLLTRLRHFLVLPVPSSRRVPYTRFCAGA